MDAKNFLRAQFLVVFIFRNAWLECTALRDTPLGKVQPWVMFAWLKEHACETSLVIINDKICVDKQRLRR